MINIRRTRMLYDIDSYRDKAYYFQYNIGGRERETAGLVYCELLDREMEIRTFELNTRIRARMPENFQNYTAYIIRRIEN